MKLIEKKMNLFDVSDGYYLAHCISDDYNMGAGIAIEFNRRYHMKNKLMKYFDDGMGLGGAGCVLIDRVFNLITKEKYWHKPTYKTLTQALSSMAEQCIELNIKKIAMPKIGCGLDRLQWGRVREILKEVFRDIDIEILVCCL